MFARPPKPAEGDYRIPPLLPDPVEVAARLRGSAYAGEIEDLAGSIMEHRFPLLGLMIETGAQIDWRRDYAHGVSSGAPYFRRSPYLDFSRVGDHKVIWELNRHQHLVVLAQAFLFSGRREFLDEIFRQLESWMDANPFLRGMNWASALEVAFRALSWIWVWIMAGGHMPEPLRRRFLTALFRHGCFLEHNLSLYFSPNTHLLGEAVALHALGALFPSLPRSARWVRTGGRTVRQQIERQVLADGSHFEQSVYYHVYALDFFLLHRALAQAPESYDQRLRAMADYLDSVMGRSGILPLFGDDDGGRVFHPYGDRMAFGRATMASCAVVLNRPEWLREEQDLSIAAAWWFRGAASFAATRNSDFPAPRLFRDCGVGVMSSGDRQIIVKAGGFGEGSGGHSHSDALSLVVRIGGREALIDPGTFTYVADPEERERFRGSAAHNTLRIDDRDQAIPAGPFRWNEKPTVVLHDWITSATTDFLDASCLYGGFTHRRRVRFLKPDLLLVLDTVLGPPGEHSVEQFWHLESRGEGDRLSFAGPAEVFNGWRSRCFAHKQASPVIRIGYRGPLPAIMAAVVDLTEEPLPRRAAIYADSGRVTFLWNGNPVWEVLD